MKELECGAQLEWDSVVFRGLSLTHVPFPLMTTIPGVC